MNALTFSFIIVGLLLVNNLFALLYSLVLLYTDWLKKYRIQEKKYQKGIFFKRMPLYLFNFSLLVLFAGFGSYFIFPFLEQSWSSWWLLALQVLGIFLVEDVFFYFYHRLLHVNKFLLAKIHSIHHRASPPFPLEYLYNHPLEWILGFIGPVIGFVIVGLISPISIFTVLIFGAIRNLREIHLHSDVNLPVLSKIPLISKTKHHDDHHSFLDGNYSSIFIWWDKIFKTELPD
ncbi:MAG: sterol desaturase family protein [Bacteroidetes bacterium]|nr:sterol desaturase family protein [Bacteroidota bacterium]